MQQAEKKIMSNVGVPKKRKRRLGNTAVCSNCGSNRAANIICGLPSSLDAVEKDIGNDG